MTREEAIRVIENRDSIMDYCESAQLGEALDMAIESLSTEPCDDAISRATAIKEIQDRRLFKHVTKDGWFWLADEKVILNVLNGLPSVTPKQKMGRWIPVSERLPYPFSYVNCTCHSLIDDREDWVVETFYLPQPPNSPYSDWGNIPMLNWHKCEVIAWMYRNIPEPYKAESEGTE